MIPEIGLFALILALVLTCFSGISALTGVAKGHAALIFQARPAATAIFLLVGVAYLCLTVAFIQNDFSVAYVAQNSNSLLPLPYRIAGVWGGHEGSLLLWAFFLCLWTFAVALFSRQLPDAMRAQILGTLFLVTAGFLLFILLTSNPFIRLLPAAPEGRDLNPMLQDPGLIIHPPLLYMGYVGFAVAYAFAVSALLSGRLDAAWARWTRPWTVASWIFLTLGIACGSWWAYYELGWGGWWFWDPVENASFLPWLIGTALIHSLAVTEKRGAFKNWTILLAISAFSLSLLGTFLVRSGVLSSVHAFASDPSRGIFILVFLAVVVGVSLALFVWRAPTVGLGGRFSLLSRESLLLSNNVLLAVATGTVLLGTIYPLILDALALGRISVGPPYFNTVFVPLMFPLLFLVGVGSFARWKKASMPEIFRLTRIPFALALLLALLVPCFYAEWKITVVPGLFMAFWIFLAAVRHCVYQVRAAETGRFAALLRQPPAFWGMHLAHVGVAIFVAGVTLVTAYEEEKDVRMFPNDTVTLAGHTFHFLGMRQVDGPNYLAWQGDVELFENGRMKRKLYPEKRFFHSSAMPMTKAAIDNGLFRDVYVSLGEPIDRAHPEKEWIVRVYYKPLVNWIWGGTYLMSLGGLIAILDRRYRLRRKKTNGEEHS
ncbi:MAG: heme lyase CcmF/NrfE family subunit [Betaproteobacteria bacterium]|nr:heme lyase CcmF/NrfE family subunit [Betaproteobacteria bacterium]